MRDWPKKVLNIQEWKKRRPQPRNGKFQIQKYCYYLQDLNFRMINKFETNSRPLTGFTGITVIEKFIHLIHILNSHLNQILMSILFTYFSVKFSFLVTKKLLSNSIVAVRTFH